ncbi:MAG: amidohydrolase family protein, partial [Betaproteobacteria bacterium]
MTQRDQLPHGSFDTIIKNASIYDGSGGAPQVNDIGITGERITQIGDISASAKNIVNADGLAIMPGIIDVHTHYDAQLTWDPTVSPSPSMGVTTIVIGNCGFGIAPCPPALRQTILENLSVVEGMNLDSLVEGTRWEFETFSEYLDFIQEQHPFVNVAALIGHSAIRTAVMGNLASESPIPSKIELAKMVEIVEKAIDDGAIGFASSFSPNHSGYMGKPMPSTIAGDEELAAMLQPLKEKQKGVFVIAAGSRATPEYLENLCERIGCPVFIVTVLAMHNDSSPTVAPNYYKQCSEAMERGHEIYVHANPHPLSFDFTLRNPYLFFSHSAFEKIKQSKANDLENIYRSAEFRSEFLKNLDQKTTGALFNGEWEKIEHNEVPITELAREQNQRPIDWFFDQDLDKPFIAKLFQNNDHAVAKLLKHKNAVLGLSDAGAHMEFLCDAGYGLFFLDHWTIKSGVFTVEEAVKKLTSDVAEKYRIKDRGKIEKGYFADLLLFDPKQVGITKMYRTEDLPN